MTFIYGAAIFACIGLSPIAVLIATGVGIMLVFYGTFGAPAPQDVGDSTANSGAVILVESPAPCPEVLPAGVREGTSTVLPPRGGTVEGHNGGTVTNALFNLVVAAIYGWVGGLTGRFAVEGLKTFREWWQFGKLEKQLRKVKEWEKEQGEK